MDEITAIILPGLDGTGKLLGQFVSLAPPRVACVVVRYPAQEHHTYESLTKLVLQQLPADDPLLIIAESFSGPIGVRVAAALGRRVSRLVLTASFIGPPAPRLARCLPWSLLFQLGAPLWALRHLIVGSAVSPSLADEVRSVIRPVDPQVLAGRIRSLLCVDAAADLAMCTCRVLYVQAVQDRLVPARCAGDVLKHCPRAEIAQIPGSHFILQEQPRDSWELIARFCRESPAHQSDSEGPGQ